LIKRVIVGQRDRAFVVSKVEANEVTGDAMPRACEAPYPPRYRLYRSLSVTLASFERSVSRSRIAMRASVIGGLLLVLNQASWAQQLPVEARACITKAAGKLPKVVTIEGSRVVPQAQDQGRHERGLYHVKVEIDVSVAGQTSTYVFNCIHSGEMTVIQPLGMGGPSRMGQPKRMLADPFEQGVADPFEQEVAAWNRGDYATALQLFRPRAEGGNIRAQALLGFSYTNGLGVPQDYVEAAKWYQRAADSGDDIAQYHIGIMHRNGQGVPRDLVRAYMWFDLAVMRGHRGTAMDRDRLAASMTAAQIAEAQELARKWKLAEQIRQRALESGQLSAAVAAIREIGVLSGQSIERKEVGPPGAFDDLSDDQLERALRERWNALGLTPDAGSNTQHWDRFEWLKALRDLRNFGLDTRFPPLKE
jgi:hypothetical protein